MSEQNGGSVAARPSLVPAIRSSLNAKLDRLLHRPLIAELVNSDPSAEADQEEEDDIPDIDDWNAQIEQWKKKYPI